LTPPDAFPRSQKAFEQIAGIKFACRGVADRPV
jgi:hypothetical protein